MTTSEPSAGIPARTISLPGFGKPLNCTPRGEERWSLLFPNALDPDDIEDGCITRSLTTLREFVMMRFMNAVTDKDRWEEKVFDDGIAAHWTAEALAIPSAELAPSMTPAMAAYCIAELRHKASLYRATRAVSVYDADVVKSDSELKAALNALEAAVPPAKRDWHPGSNEMVLDLVHPSLYPLVYGHSRILPDGTLGIEDALRRTGEGVIVPVPAEQETMLPLRPGSYMLYSSREKVYSQRFQWLPCDVALIDEGGERSARIASYVPNLHPTIHASLYPLLSKLITYTIPLWNLTLTGYTDGMTPRITYTSFPHTPILWHPPDEPQQRDDEDREEFHERWRWWNNHIVEVEQPDVESEFQPPNEERPNYMRQRVDLANQYEGFQVIVKVASIVLTPEKPEYKGGTWHVEGMLNEHICASAIYYYDFENITESRLSFRQHSSSHDASDVKYAQNQHIWLWQVFGCENDQPTVQYIGDVTAREGRLVTFPNTLQHKVEPFRLADPTKPGHRKIVALFLVDPYIRIISTANVPPQRRDWWAQQVITAESPLTRLPAELQLEIVKNVDGFPMSQELAERYREELMEERKADAVMQTENFIELTFSLCEH
ncbi:hypothetical protein BDZ91DRAFT_752164 [Kalaharituber pfeilii]|nr:hypothetical protein BDZ91DRAFT_752583 [Kalaharituber pfeilii]KAF8448393.1 hypothetical protein BDZ91DRAFT_752164 [Kalaharituber pfeilii]